MSDRDLLDLASQALLRQDAPRSLVAVIDRFVGTSEFVGARWRVEARIAPFDAIALDLAAVCGPPPASPPPTP